MVLTSVYIAFHIAISSFQADTTLDLKMEEICDNAMDDDNDGLIDINDPDCTCELVSLESIIPNPSFENQNCCPKMHSQMSCVEDWIQPSFGTSDYVHHCGYKYDAAVDNALNRFPDGDGAVGFLAGRDPDGTMHLEYVGSCLNRPLLAGSKYILKLHVGFLTEAFSPPLRLAIYGSSSCDNLPFSEFNADCPLSYFDWMLISRKEVSSDGASNVWLEFTLEIEPVIDIHAIIIGADCTHGSSEEGIGYLLDNLRLNDERNFDFELIDPGSPCSEDFTYAIADNILFSYQWYKEGIALIGETEPELSQMYGEGSYQVRIINNNTRTCRIADEFEFNIPIINSEIEKTLCEGSSFMYQGEIIDKEGTYEFLFTSAEGCDSIVMLDVVSPIIQVDTIYAKKLPGNKFHIYDDDFTKEGTYEIATTTVDGCENITILILEDIVVHIPNVFSPNADGVNDIFEVFILEDGLIMQEVFIYDRWGNLISEQEKWDGTINQVPAEAGIYVCLIKLTDENGQTLILSNSITLLR